MEQGCAFTSVCTIAHYTFYSTCMFMLPVQGHCQKKKNKKKNSHGEHLSKLTESLLLCRHILKNLSPAVQKKTKSWWESWREQWNKNTGLNTRHIYRVAGLSSGFHSEKNALQWVDSSTQAHYNLTFWSVWPSFLSQALPPFVALGPLRLCIDSLRCINPSDTGWMDSCWQDAPCHFVCCHLIRAPQFALPPFLPLLTLTGARSRRTSQARLDAPSVSTV